MLSHPKILAVAVSALLFGAAARGQTPATPPKAPRPPEPVRLGVQTPGISRPMTDVRKDAEFPVAGSPDWSVMAKDAVWVTSGGRTNHIVQLIPATNKVGLIVDVPRPCSGLADGFGSVWSPSCSTHTVFRVDPATGNVLARIPADPANSEGGITVGDGSIWIVTKPSTLVRIDPKTNTITASVALPAGSENPLFADGFVWVSGFERGDLLKIDPATDKLVDTIKVGPKPRFLTAGAGSIWTLNQGDGSISRVDQKTGKLLATIVCGIQGGGGEITFGNGHVWATMFDFPLTEIDPATNKVLKQWGGKGGDGIRFGFGSVWLSNGAMATVWRLSPDQQ